MGYSIGVGLNMYYSMEGVDFYTHNCQHSVGVNRWVLIGLHLQAQEDVFGLEVSVCDVPVGDESGFNRHISIVGLGLIGIPA
jgi:hypothetical protein